MEYKYIIHWDSVHIRAFIQSSFCIVVCVIIIRCWANLRVSFDSSIRIITIPWPVVIIKKIEITPGVFNWDSVSYNGKVFPLYSTFQGKRKHVYALSLNPQHNSLRFFLSSSLYGLKKQRLKENRGLAWELCLELNYPETKI